MADRATCSEALEAAGARCEWMAWPSPSAKHAAAPARDRQDAVDPCRHICPRVNRPLARAPLRSCGVALVWADFGPLYSTRRAAALAAHHSSAQRRQRREQCGQRLGRSKVAGLSSALGRPEPHRRRTDRRCRPTGETYWALSTTAAARARRTTRARPTRRRRRARARARGGTWRPVAPSHVDAPTAEGAEGSRVVYRLNTLCS